MNNQNSGLGASRWLRAVFLCTLVSSISAASSAQTVVAPAVKPGEQQPNFVPPPPDPEDQTRDAAVVSVQVPTTLTVGQTFQPSITFRNMGNPVWTGYPYRAGAVYEHWGANRADFGGSVPYYQTITLTPTLTAPSTPGSYPFAWRMLYENVEWFGASTQVYTINVIAPTNNAAAGAVSAPSSMTPGQSSTASVTMTNTGTTTWTSATDYKLGFVNDNSLWGDGRVALPYSVAPGASVTFTVPLTAPMTPGTYQVQWGMLREYVAWFGGLSAIKTISVVGAPQPPTISVSRSPSTMQANQAFTLTWSSTNATSVTRVCTASGTGYTSSGSMALSGSSNGTASAAWVGYPSTCTWTATGSGGTASTTETMVTTGYSAAYVSQSIPTAMLAGQNYPITVTMQNNGVSSWSAANSVELRTSNPSNNTTWGLSRVTVPATVAAGQSVQFAMTVKAPAAAGTYNLQWRMWEPVSGAFGTTSANVPVVITVPAGPPTLNVSHAPVTLVEGETYTVTWTTSSATKVTMQCSDASYTVILKPAGQFSGLAKPAWAASPAVCTWTAIGLGGTATVQDTMTTQAAPAYCN
jgi:methionine-rich copper-binding protein CopC